MITERVKQFFRAGITPESHYELRRLYMTNTLVLTMAVSMMLFALINTFIFYRPYLVLIDVFAAAIATYTLVQLRRDHNLDKAASIAAYSMLAISTSFAVLNQNDNFGLIWTIFLPLFAMALKGHRTGLKITLLYYAMILPAMYFGVGHWQGGDWNAQSAMRYTIASAALVFIIYMYEHSLYEFHQQEMAAKQKLESLSRIDPLTGLYNRRAINDLLSVEIKKSQRYQTPLSVIIFDLDNFKHVNDTHGHLKGDEVLKTTSNLMQDNLRETEILGRWGGEEFILICPQLTLSQAAQLAEKVRLLIAQQRFDALGQVTASFGVTQFTTSLDLETLVAEADKALYQAKHNGKNQVVVYPPK